MRSASARSASSAATAFVRGSMYSLWICSTGTIATSVRKCGRRSDHGPGTPPNGLSSMEASSRPPATNGMGTDVAPNCAAVTSCGAPSATQVLSQRRSTASPLHLVSTLTL